METNVNYTVVGAFVVILVSAIVLAIIWLSAGLSFQPNIEYLVYMTESVSGLSEDSPVEFNGVSVGNVKSIQLNHKNPQLVEVLLSIHSGTPVTKGTIATLNTRGITGYTYVALKDKSTDLRKLKPEPGQRYAVIPTAPSLFLRLDIALSQLTTNMKKVTEVIQSVFDRQNQKSIKGILINIQSITADIAKNNAKFSEILANAANASKQFRPLLDSSTESMRLFHVQTLPAVYKVLSNMDEVARNLLEVSIELKQNPSVLIRGTTPQPLGPGEKR